MKKILVAYVPSPTSEAALDHAVAEAKHHEATLIVLASEQGTPSKARQVTDERPIQVRLEESGVPFEIRIVDRRHDPADDILDVVELEQVDWVVLGMRRRTPIGKILLGSTAQRVVLESTSPVVLVKPPGFVPPPRD